MKPQPEFLTALLERMGQEFRARAMFGGYGLYSDDLFCAIVVDEVLYLKADAESKPDFEVLGLQPFAYTMKDGCKQTMAYYPPPDAALDDDAELQVWIRKALAAALRARNKPKSRKKITQNQ